MNPRFSISVQFFLPIVLLLAWQSGSQHSIQCFAQTPAIVDSEATDLSQLVGKEIDIRMEDGTLAAFATVTKAVAGRTEGSIKSLQVTYRDSKRKKLIPVSRITELYLNDLPLDVDYQRKVRALVHSPEKRQKRLEHRRQVTSRLKETRSKYWSPLDEAQHESFIKKHREFLDKTRAELPDIDFELVETEFFLFLTDLSPEESSGYIAYLDAMYEQLCLSFGLSPEKNIWCGKCVVVAFKAKSDYVRFEARVMDNEDTEGTQGLCHQSADGTIVFVGYKGESDFFGHVLVHETAHGFVHRYMTSARPPSWLNEGMSDWLANLIVKGDQIPRKQRNAARRIIERGGWGDFLTAKQIDHDHYGAASTMVELLLSRDKNGEFRKFFIGIKEGLSADESLKKNFGLSYQDLKLLYAEAATRLAKSK